jgi:cell filamentation protein
MSDWTNPLHYPGTTVLMNRLDIRDQQHLRRIEYAAANARLRELIAKPMPGKFDLNHLRAIHKHLLGDVYAWAGQTRDEAFKGQEVVFTKGGTLFAMHSELKPAADKLFATLAKEGHLRGLRNDKNGFVERLSHYYVELNKVHPFPEGNGRATQLFLAQLAREAGYRLDFGKIDKAKWNLAARESAAGRPGMVVDAFSRIVSPHRAVAFDKLPPEEAYKKYPELRDAFVVLANARRLAEQRFKSPGDQARFINLYRTRISDELHGGNKIAPPTRERPQPARSR